MHIGFTGTRSGMTEMQEAVLTHIILHLRDHADTFHHGDCMGADARAAGVVIHLTAWRHVAHPCDIEMQRAHCMADEYRPVKKPLVRNRDIVAESDIIIAMPAQKEEQYRGSGTWATIRYARDAHKPLFIVWPDGSMSIESLTDLQRAWLDSIVVEATG